MKKVLVFAVAILTAATIFAQEKKAVIGVAKLTTTLSSAIVDGYWGDYWGAPDAKDASGYTHMQTDYNTELKERAIVPVQLSQVMQSLEYMLYDLFKDSELFEKVVECNASGSDAKDIDYLVQPSLSLLHFERSVYKQAGFGAWVGDYASIGVTVSFKDVKKNKTYTPTEFYYGTTVSKDFLEKAKERGAHIETSEGRPDNNEGLTYNSLVLSMNYDNKTFGKSTSGGLLSQAVKAAVNKNKQEEPLDTFLYDERRVPLARLVKSIIIDTYHKINPPKVEAVDENGIITFSALGFNEKDMLDVKNDGERIAEIYVYDVKDRIAYAKVDPVDPEFADAEIQEGFYILPAEREWKWQQVNNAIKNIKKEIKAIKKAQKANAKAKK